MERPDYSQKIGEFPKCDSTYMHYMNLLVEKDGSTPDFLVLRDQYRAICERIDDLASGGFRKGIVAAGPVGSGKSTAMKAAMATLSFLLKRVPGSSYISPPAICISTRALNDIFPIGTSEASYEDWASQYRHICFDDMGREEPYDRYKGLYHMTRLIQVIDEMGRKAPVVHGTTNKNRAEIMLLYGEHIIDRFRRLSTPLRFNTTKSLREL